MRVESGGTPNRKVRQRSVDRPATVGDCQPDADGNGIPRGSNKDAPGIKMQGRDETNGFVNQVVRATSPNVVE